MEHYSVKLDNGRLYCFNGELLGSGLLNIKSDTIHYCVYRTDDGRYILQKYEVIDGEEVIDTMHPEYDLSKIIRILEYNKMRANEGQQTEDFDEFFEFIKKYNHY